MKPTASYQPSAAKSFEILGQFAQTLLYDGSFAGLLSAIFNSYSFASPCQFALQETHIPTLFEQTVTVQTDEAKAERVWNGLQQKCGIEIANMVQLAFLSHKTTIPTLLAQYLRLLFANPNQARNLLDPVVQSVFDTARQVRHEAHRFQGFVRFRKSKENFLFALIDPENDIIDILHPHFQRRYPQESWMLIDSNRGKGIRFEKGSATPLFCDPSQLPQSDLACQTLAQEGEDQWIELWKSYYQAINIVERKNTKLMFRCLPRKYWKYLPERQNTTSIF